jgi:hypothetical protein
MYSIERLDVISNEVNEFSHDGFDPRGIPGRIGSLEKDAVQAFVICADAQSLTRRPFCSRCVEGLQTMLGISAREIHDPRLDCRLNPLQNDPVRRPEPVEWSSVDEFKSLSPVVRNG